MAAIRIPEESAPRYGGPLEIRLNPWSDVIFRGPLLIMLGAGALYAATLLREPAIAILCQAAGSVLLALAGGLGLMAYQAATWSDFRVRLDHRQLSFPQYPSWMMETSTLRLDEVRGISVEPSPEGLAVQLETNDRTYTIPARWLPKPWTPQVLAYQLQLRWVLRQRLPEQLTAAEAALLRTDRPAWGVVVDPRGDRFEARWVVHTQEEYSELAAARQVSPEHRLIMMSQIFPGFQEAFRPHPYRKLAAAVDATFHAAIAPESTPNR